MYVPVRSNLTDWPNQCLCLLYISVNTNFNQDFISMSAVQPSNSVNQSDKNKPNSNNMHLHYGSVVFF